MSHPEVESNPGEASSSVLWEHSSKRERIQVDKQRPRVSLQKSEAGKRYRAGPGVPLCACACRLHSEAEAGQSLKFPAWSGLRTRLS